MSKFTSKIASVGLTAITVVSLSGFAVLPAAAQTSDVQAQITALLAQIAALQSQLGTGTSTSTTAYAFTRSLTVGSRGDDVTALQNYLKSTGNFSGTATGYFGSITKAAVAAWQTANGVSPAAGYFGTISRAKYVSVAGTSTTTTTTTTTVTGAPMSVMASSDNPVSANVQKGSANNAVLKVTFTGGATVSTITGLTIKSYGTTEATGSTDVSAVKLYDENGIQVGNDRTPAGNTINFVIVPALTIPVNGSRTITVNANIGTGAAVVATVRYGIESATAISGGTTFTGSYPIIGNSFTIVPAGQLGSLSVSKYGTVPATTAKVGKKDVIVESFNISAGSNEDLSVNQAVLTNTGSVTGSDLSNLRLRKVGTTTVLATASLVNNKATFNLTTPIALIKGASANVEVVADIADGGTNARTIIMAVAAGGVVGKGATSGTNITSTGSTTGTTITLGNETVTVSMSSSHPQGAAGYFIETTNKKDLAKFDVRANGGNVIFNAIQVKMVDSTSALTSSNYISSVGLYDGDSLVSDLLTFNVETEQSFALNWTVSADTTKTLTLKGVTGTLDAAAPDTVTTTFGGYTAYGLASGATLTSTADIGSTAITVYAAGTTTLAADSVKTPYSQGILYPVNNVTLGALKVYAQRENLKLNAATVKISASTYADGSVSSVTLYADDGVTQLSNPITYTAGSNLNTFVFASTDYLNDIIFTKDVYKTILVKGNVAAGDGQTGITVEIPASTLTFTGQDSGASHTGAATLLSFASPYAGGTYKFDKTLVEIKKSADSPTGLVARGSDATYASWDVSNVSSDLVSIRINQLKLTSKSGLSTGLDDAADETLFKVYDEAGNVVFAGDATKDALVKASGTIYFNGGTSTDYTRALTVAAGAPKKLVLRIDTTSSAKWPTSQQMQWSIELVGDVTVQTGTPSNFTADGFVGYGGTTFTIPATTNIVTLP